MNLVSALNSFLNHFYSSMAPPARSGQSITARAFYDSVIVQAVKSPEFRERLVKNPEIILAEIGIDLPDGVKVTFVENTDQLVHIVIPPYIGE
jgi:hypothetical protein